MSTFRVGIRVRCKDGLNKEFAIFIGAETQIIGDGFDALGSYWELGLIDPLDGEQLVCNKDVAGDFLEPILPEGMQPTTWDKCLWQPEGVAV